MPSLHIVSASVAVGTLCAICAGRDPGSRILTFDCMRSILRFAVITPNASIRIFRNHRSAALRGHLRRMPSMQPHRQLSRDDWAFQPNEPT
jgi:hypothetical protein